MRLQIVCRGSAEHGLGHLFRSKSLARAAADGNTVEVIVLAERHLEVLFHDLPCAVRFADRDDAVAGAVRDFAPDVVVFDLLALDPAVFGAVKATGALLASISPVFSMARDLDILFTRAAPPPETDGVAVHSGLEYAIFNDYCHRIDERTYERSLRDPVLPIGLSMGGGDSGNFTLATLEIILRAGVPCSIWVCLGEAYHHSFDDLVATSRRYPRQEVILARTNRSMWRVLENCAVAVLSGGLSTIEAIYAGLPAIQVFPSKERADSIAELYGRAVTIDGGIAEDGSVHSLTAIIEDLHAERDRLRAMRMASMERIDGQGSRRVLAALQKALAHGPAVSVHGR